MIANCPQCSMTLSFDDQRLPVEPFNVVCPRCRQSVTIMPPPKDDPLLPGVEATSKTGPLEIGPNGIVTTAAPDAPTQTDPMMALAEMLLAGLKQSKEPDADVSKWQRHRMLLCLDDKDIRERLRASLDVAKYEVFSASSMAEALEILYESRSEVIVLGPNFDPEQQGGAFMMQHINSLTPQTRRRTYVVLVSPQLRTFDTYLAFANGVNLTVHPEDVDSFQSLFERSLRDFNELYRPLNHATSTPPL